MLQSAPRFLLSMVYLINSRSLPLNYIILLLDAKREKKRVENFHLVFVACFVIIIFFPATHPSLALR